MVSADINQKTDENENFIKKISISSLNFISANTVHFLARNSIVTLCNFKSKVSIDKLTYFQKEGASPAIIDDMIDLCIYINPQTKQEFLNKRRLKDFKLTSNVLSVFYQNKYYTLDDIDDFHKLLITKGAGLVTINDIYNFLIIQDLPISKKLKKYKQIADYQLSDKALITLYKHGIYFTKDLKPVSLSKLYVEYNVKIELFDEITKIMLTNDINFANKDNEKHYFCNFEMDISIRSLFYDKKIYTFEDLAMAIEKRHFKEDDLYLYTKKALKDFVNSNLQLAGTSCIDFVNNLKNDVIVEQNIIDESLYENLLSSSTSLSFEIFLDKIFDNFKYNELKLIFCESKSDKYSLVLQLAKTFETYSEFQVNGILKHSISLNQSNKQFKEKYSQNFINFYKIYEITNNWRDFQLLYNNLEFDKNFFKYMKTCYDKSLNENDIKKYCTYGNSIPFACKFCGISTAVFADLDFIDNPLFFDNNNIANFGKFKNGIFYLDKKSLIKELYSKLFYYTLCPNFNLEEFLHSILDFPEIIKDNNASEWIFKKSILDRRKKLIFNKNFSTTFFNEINIENNEINIDEILSDIDKMFLK